LAKIFGRNRKFPQTGMGQKNAAERKNHEGKQG